MNFSSNGMTNVVALLSLLVSASLALFYLRDRRHAKFGIESEYISQLLSWYSEVIQLLVSLKESINVPDRPERSLDLSRLSSLIERGRFFFPNIDRGDGFGEERPPAYRGYRNLALDFLVASYNLHKGKNPSQHADQAEQLSRYFTSIVFDIVRPKDRLEQIRVLTDKYFVQEKCVEDFLEQGNYSAIQFIWER